MEKQNITLSLPKRLLVEARHLAVERGTSLSGLLAEYLERIVTEDREYEAAARRIKKRISQGLDLGTGGKVDWSRDELHER